MTLTQVNLRRRKHECCVFDGVEESIQVGDVTALQFDRFDTWSIAVWFKTQSAATGFRCFVAKGFHFGGSGLGAGWEFSLLDGHLHTRIDHDDVTNGITKQTPASYNDNNWHHAVLTYAGTSLAPGVLAYADGANVTFTTIANTLAGSIVTARPFEIGVQDTFGPWLGYLDEIAIFNKVLSAAEVTELYHSGTVFDYRTSTVAGNLLGYWRMAEDSTFPTIPDVSANLNHGTMTNMQHFGPTRSRVPRPA